MEIDLIIPYQRQNQTIFHLQLEQSYYDKKVSLEVNSSLSPLALATSYPGIKRKRKTDLAITLSQAYWWLKEISIAIREDSLTPFFYYPHYLLRDGSVNEEVAKAHMVHLGGYKLVPGNFASPGYQPVFLSTFNQLIISNYIYYPYLYIVHVIDISRKEFESELPESCKIEYFKIEKSGVMFRKYITHKVEILLLIKKELSVVFFVVIKNSGLNDQIP